MKIDCDTCHGLGRNTLFAGTEKVECTCMVCNGTGEVTKKELIK